MAVFLTIRDQDVIPGALKKKIDYTLREASRGVVFDQDGKIAVLHVGRDDYYKLPGGGLEAGEDNLTAMVRECLEETGCYIQNLREIGQIVEYRDRHKMLQKSYCYVAEVKGEKGQPSFDRGEKTEGFALKWLDFDEALRIFLSQQPEVYNGKFIVKRDLFILQKAQELYGRKK